MAQVENNGKNSHTSSRTLNKDLFMIKETFKRLKRGETDSINQ